MTTQQVAKGVDEFQRIEKEFLEQRDALNAEAKNLTQRMATWRDRRSLIDDALSKLHKRLGPEDSKD